MALCHEERVTMKHFDFEFDREYIPRSLLLDTPSDISMTYLSPQQYSMCVVLLNLIYYDYYRMPPV